MRRLLLPALLVLSLAVFAACGSDDDPTATPTAVLTDPNSLSDPQEALDGVAERTRKIMEEAGYYSWN